MARPGKPKRVPTLPAAKDRRPELVHTSTCPRCGFTLGTVDLNTSSHLRAFVLSGAEGPVDPAAVAKVQQAWAQVGSWREDCPCGAAIEHTPEIDNPAATLLGTVTRDVTRPIVDGARVVAGRLVVFGRFLEGAKVRQERGLEFVPAADVTPRENELAVDVVLGKDKRKTRCFARPAKPWELRAHRMEKRTDTLELRHHDKRVTVRIECHALHLDHPIPPRAGDTVVLTVEDAAGAVAHSVHVTEAS